MHRLLLPAILALLTFSASTLRAAEPAAKDLPQVLIIGDSISIGYTPFATAFLKDKAIVKHNPGNAQHTGTGLAKLDAWLGDTKWDVIHFNWGLWDLCYRDPHSTSEGKLTFTPEQYGKNMEQLVTRLKKTGAKLIFANTTNVPAGEPGRFDEDDLKYNAVAEAVMKKHGVEVNDLYTLTANFPAELYTRPGNVHFKPEGSKKLGKQVADTIEKHLPKE